MTKSAHLRNIGVQLIGCSAVAHKRTSLVLISCLAVMPWIFPSATDAQESTSGLTASVTRPIHPVLIRNQHGPLLRVVVDVGEKQDVQIHSLSFSLAATDDRDDLDGRETLRHQVVEERG